MACFNPTFAWRTREPHPRTGRPQYSTDSREAVNVHDPVTWPCGKCIGCFARRAQEWGIRAQHEAFMNECNCFVTLTYDPHHLPADRALDEEHMRNFIKRLRKKIAPVKIKYLYCGEYGPRTGRPHYHICIFGYDFADKQLRGHSAKGFPFYRSPELKKLWKMGRHTIQDFTYETATYVAKYTHKFNIKMRGRIDLADGRRGEFSRQSNGLGLAFFEKFTTDIYPSDEVAIRGNSGIYFVKPPRYYDDKFAEVEPETFEAIRRKRAQTAWRKRHDNTPARLAVKEEIRLLRLKQSPREIE